MTWDSNMTWTNLAMIYREACENAVEASVQQWVHLTHGQRQLQRRLDLPEMFQDEAFVSVAQDPQCPGEYLDYIENDEDVHHIDSIVNGRVGEKIDPEPDGMPGRDRYLTDTHPTGRLRPPEGEVRWYVRQGNRIWLRNRPTEETPLVIRYFRQAKQLSAADVNLHPVSPPQYDTCIAFFAAHQFFATNPAANTQHGASGQSKADYFLGLAENELQRGLSPKAEEQKAQRSTSRVAGFSFRARSAR